MSGHCQSCGTYQEEDDGRLCSSCRRGEARSRQEYDPSCEITKAEFDALCADPRVSWSMQPRIEASDACGYRDVAYMPNKRADGILADGRYVWCWAVGAKVKRTARKERGA